MYVLFMIENGPHHGTTGGHGASTSLQQHALALLLLCPGTFWNPESGTVEHYSTGTPGTERTKHTHVFTVHVLFTCSRARVSRLTSQNNPPTAVRRPLLCLSSVVHVAQADLDPS